MKLVIGIRKFRIITGMLLGVFLVTTIIVCAFMWAIYKANYDNEYWIKNGVEVEAICFDWGSEAVNNGGHLSNNRINYISYYKYVDDNNKTYYVRRYFERESDAVSQLGEKMIIVIDPNSTRARHVDLNSLSLDYEKDLTIAIVFCFPIPFVLYLLIYRGLYRSILNSKIRNEVGVSLYEKEEEEYSNLRKPEIDEPLESYDPAKIKTGEVVKTISWIVSYVKVKCTDNKGIEQIKWARSWFTRKEAKYLAQKKFINIVPYKNTYGILEEMPSAKN